MNQQPWDADGGAREALGSAVSNYGPRVLGDAQILGNMVTDLLPDSPRERSLLVAAAETGVAAQLRQHIDEQHIDAATAVRLAADSLSDQKSIEPGACLWVTAEFARALGYEVPESISATPEGGASAPEAAAAPPVAAPVPTPAPAAAPAPVPAPGGVHDNQTQVAPGQTVPGPPVWSNSPWPQGGAVGPQGGSMPPGGALMPQQPPAPPSAWGNWGPPQSPWVTGSQPPPPKRPPSGRKRALIAVLAVVAIAGIYLLAAGLGKFAPFQTSAAGHTTPPTTHTTTKPPPTTTTPAEPALTDVLTVTGHVTDTTTQCSAATVPSGLIMPGMTEALACNNISGLSGGNVYAYQMDNASDFQTAWKNYNQWWTFDSLTAETSCPPTGSKTAHGSNTWYSQTYPRGNSEQVIECEWVGSSYTIPAYSWTVPSANAIIVAQGPDGGTFDALNAWWAGTATSTP